MIEEPTDPSDYIATLEADLGHDAAKALPQISAPTLVIAGTPDFFYPSRSFVRRPNGSRTRRCGCTTASATRSPRPHKRRFEDDVLAFLDR